MVDFTLTDQATRRGFLKTSGMLVVSIGALPLDLLATAEAVARGQGATSGQGAGR